MSLRTPLALLLGLALAAACGGDDDGGGGGGGELGGGAVDPADCPVAELEGATAPVEIVFWHSMGATNQDALEELTDRYNESQDRVRVELQYQGSYTETATKVENGVRSGEGLPHLVQLEETRVQFAIDSGVMLPAQSCVEADSYDLGDHLPVAVEQFTVEGNLWSMPFNVSNPVLYYLESRFAAAGLDPDDPPSTFDELRAAADALVSEGGVDTGLVFDLSPGFIEQWFALEDEPIVDNENGRAGRAETANLDTELGRTIYEFLDGMVDDGLARSVGRNPQGVDHLLALAQGDSAMTYGSSAAIGPALAVIRSGEVDVDEDEVRIAPFPAPTDDPAGGTVVGGGSLHLVAEGTDPLERAATWDFVKYLNEPDTQARWHRTGYIPIRQSSVDIDPVPELWRETPGFKVAYDQILASDTSFGGPVIGAYFEFREAIIKSLERMFEEGESPADAVRTADEEAEAEMADYNSRTG